MGEQTELQKHRSPPTPPPRFIAKPALAGYPQRGAERVGTISRGCIGYGWSGRPLGIDGALGRVIYFTAEKPFIGRGL